MSPRTLNHSSIFSLPSLTRYLRAGFDAFLALQLFSIDLMIGNSSYGGYMIAFPFGFCTFAAWRIIMSAVCESSSSIHIMGDVWDIFEDIIVGGSIFSSFAKNVAACSFRISLYLGKLMSSLIGEENICSWYIGLSPILLFAALRIVLRLSS